MQGNPRKSTLGVWIPRHGFWISGIGFRILCQWNSTLWIPDFSYWIPVVVSGTWILDSLSCIQDSPSKNFPDPEIRIPLHGRRPRGRGERKSRWCGQPSQLVGIGRDGTSHESR